MQIRGVPHPYNKQIYKICKVTNYNHTSICNKDNNGYYHLYLHKLSVYNIVRIHI